MFAKSLAFRAVSLLAVVSSLGLVACAGEAVEGDEQATHDEVRSTSAHFETFDDDAGKPRFQLFAGNGALMLESEAYESVKERDEGIDSVLKHGVNAAQYKLGQAKNGGFFFFNLRSTNNKVVGSSGTYTSEASAKRAIKTVIALVTIAAGEAAESRVRRAEAGRRFETFRDEEDRQRFRLRLERGEIALESDELDDANRAATITLVRQRAGDDDGIEVVDEPDGRASVRVRERAQVREGASAADRERADRDRRVLARGRSESDRRRAEQTRDRIREAIQIGRENRIETRAAR